MADEKIIDRITKLLAKAESTTEHEAAALMEKAQELMTEHAIALDQLRAKDHGDERPVRVTIKVRPTWFVQDTDLLDGICRANDCQLYFCRPTATIVGFRDDVDNVQVLYVSLLAQLGRAVRGVVSEEWGVSDDACRRAFRKGYAARIAYRLSMARLRVVRHADEVADGCLLPVLAEKADQVKAALPDDLRQARECRPASDLAFRSGAYAAERADIGNPRVTASARPAIGSTR